MIHRDAKNTAKMEFIIEQGLYFSFTYYSIIHFLSTRFLSSSLKYVYDFSQTCLYHVFNVSDSLTLTTRLCFYQHLSICSRASTILNNSFTMFSCKFLMTIARNYYLHQWDYGFVLIWPSYTRTKETTT